MLRRALAAQLLAVALAGCTAAGVASPDVSVAPPSPRPSSTFFRPTPFLQTPTTRTPGPSATPAGPAPTANAEALAHIVRAATATAAQETVRFDLVAEFTGGAVQGSFTAEGQMAGGETRRGWMSFDLTASGAGRIEMIVDDTRMYMRGDVLARQTGTTKWIMLDLAAVAGGAEQYREMVAGSNDPRLSVAYLAGVGDRIRVRGTERVDGVQTTRYSMKVDLRAAAEAAPDAVAANLEETLRKLRQRGMSTTIGAEAWIGTDDLVRRLKYVYDLGSTGQMTMTFDLSGYGDPVEITVPPTSETIPFSQVLPG